MHARRAASHRTFSCFAFLSCWFRYLENAICWVSVQRGMAKPGFCRGFDNESWFAVWSLEAHHEELPRVRSWQVADQWRLFCLAHVPAGPFCWTTHVGLGRPGSLLFWVWFRTTLLQHPHPTLRPHHPHPPFAPSPPLAARALCHMQPRRCCVKLVSQRFRQRSLTPGEFWCQKCLDYCACQRQESKSTEKNTGTVFDPAIVIVEELHKVLVQSAELQAFASTAPFSLRAYVDWFGPWRDSGKATLLNAITNHSLRTIMLSGAQPGNHGGMSCKPRPCLGLMAAEQILKEIWLPSCSQEGSARPTVLLTFESFTSVALRLLPGDSGETDLAATPSWLPIARCWANWLLCQES